MNPDQMGSSPYCMQYTVKPVLSGHSKIDKTWISMTNGSLIQVESIAAFCDTFDVL